MDAMREPRKVKLQKSPRGSLAVGLRRRFIKRTVELMGV